jgi:uncharacterized membrane protein YgdD (TMEM256/DUF423 family)
MSKKIVLTAAILLCMAIILGAMAAHALEKIIGAAEIKSFHTGVTYQFYAGFALLILGLAGDKFSFSLKWFTRLTIAGVILFSGCIYLYCFHEQAPGLKNFVLIVPVGGFSFIAAWLLFIVQLIKAPRT